MEKSTEIYPMPMFVRLDVSDLDESLAWYEALGFDVVYSMPVMAHVRFRMYADIMLTADGVELGEEPIPPDRPRGEGVSVYVNVEDGSIDDVADRARRNGAKQVEGPEKSSWNTREVTITDPDGYELVFTEPVDIDMAFEDVMGESNPP